MLKSSKAAFGARIPAIEKVLLTFTKLEFKSMTAGFCF